jgi:MFS family permease
MFVVAVVLCLLDRTNSPALAGAVVAAASFPSLVTGPVLGAWFDRARHRSALLSLDQAVAAVTIAAILLTAGKVPPAVLIAIAVVSGTTLPLSGGGFTSLIPALVPDELLVRANALEAASFNVATVAGPALAGSIAAAAGADAAVATEIGHYCVAFLLVLGIGAGPGSPQAESLRTTIRSGLAHVIRTPALAAVTLSGSLALLARGLLVIAFPLLAAEELGADPSAAGYLWGAFALGSLVGAVGLVRLHSDSRPELTMLAATALAALVMPAWALPNGIAAVGALVALSGLAYGPGLAATFTVRQRWTPERLRGQVFMTAASMKPALFAVGAALAGPIAADLGPGTAIVIAAGVQLAAAAAGWMVASARV